MRIKLSGVLLRPATRLAIGLALITVALIISLDYAVDLFPDPGKVAAESRTASAQLIGARISSHLNEAGRDDLTDDLRDAIKDDPSVLGAAIRMKAGTVLAQVGMVDPAPPPDGHSTLNRIIVPIERNGSPWAQLEIAFASAYPTTLLGWLTQPLVRTLLGIVLLGSFAYRMYLRRVLKYLDPRSVVPERVRAAFDAFAEGVIILDTNDRIVLANAAFRDMVPAGSPDFYGRPAGAVSWLAGALARVREDLPWAEAIREDKIVQSVPCEVVSGLDSVPRRLIIKANPISDGKGKHRGCIVTLNDVSDLHRSNQALNEALQQIETKNATLRRLAAHDPLTDCLNRRAFFEELSNLQADTIAREGYLCMAACDLDRFKTINDTFGHAAGDRVLIAAAAAFRSALRDGDLLCRMGGEEFCVVWRASSPEGVAAYAEGLRRAVEMKSTCISDDRATMISPTVSIGVACGTARDVTFEALNSAADQALYEAKRNGRNRVCIRPGIVRGAAAVAR